VFLALFVHALLLLALTWGVQWRDQPQDMSVEAELWSAMPQPVAAKEERMPEPKEAVEPAPKAEPKPVPPPPPEKTATKPSVQAQIAIEKQKEAQEKAKELKRLKAEEAKKAEQRYQEDVRRLQGLADATGTPADAGKAAKAAAPSATYLGKLRAKVKPYIVFSDTQLLSVIGNPAAEVEVTCSPSGQILSAKLSVSSGNAAWDLAVLNAVEKTASLPRDEDGNMPSKISFSFRPRD